MLCIRNRFKPAIDWIHLNLVLLSPTMWNIRYKVTDQRSLGFNSQQIVFGLLGEQRHTPKRIGQLPLKL